MAGRGRPKAVQGGKTVGLYLDAGADGWIDRVSALTGGNRSPGAVLALNVHRALTEAYVPPLGRDERLLVLNALNGVALHQAPPESWRGALLGNLLADGGEDEQVSNAAVEALIGKLRAMPRWEMILLVQWALLVWDSIGSGADVEAFLEGEGA